MRRRDKTAATRRAIILATCSGSILVGGIIGVALFERTRPPAQEAAATPKLDCANAQRRHAELDVQREALTQKRAEIARELDPMKAQLAEDMVSLEVFVRETVHEGGRGPELESLVSQSIAEMKATAERIDVLMAEDERAKIALSNIDARTAALFGDEIDAGLTCGAELE